MYDARQIANWFVNRSSEDGKGTSIMTLLKLVYIAHGWFMESRKTPLFPNAIQAWKHGPVIPDVYRAFRTQGIAISKPVELKAGLPAIAPQDEDFLKEIYRIYGHLSPFVLSDLTHVPGGPWDIASRSGGHYAEISNASILKHYEAKRVASKGARLNAG